MATSRVALTVLTYAGLSENGVQLLGTNASVANGNRWSNTDRNTVLFVGNPDVSPHTVTFTWTRRGQTVTKAVTIAASSFYVLGPFVSEFGDHPSADGADGDVYVTADSTAILFSAVRMPIAPVIG